MEILIVLVLLLLLTAVWDFYKGKIPNVFIISGCCYGMIRLLYYGNILKHIPGIIFPVLVLFPLYKIGVMGAGDLKLLSVLGFYFPFSELIFCIFMAFLLGAFLSLFSLIRYENFYERMTYLFSYLKECFCLGHFRYYYLNSGENQDLDSGQEHSKIHFAVPIFISVVLHVGGVF